MSELCVCLHRNVHTASKPCFDCDGSGKIYPPDGSSKKIACFTCEGCRQLRPCCRAENCYCPSYQPAREFVVVEKELAR